MTEKEKHWNDIKFNAQEWRRWESKEDDLKLKRAALDAEIIDAHKKAKFHAHKTQRMILIEVV
jgi:hypothetical protein